MTDAFLSAAFRFRKLKLWARIEESSAFAVRTAGGELLYCNVTGRSGEHLALGVYPGEEAARTFHRLLTRRFDTLTPLQMQEFTMAQDCIQCSFENKEDAEPDEVTAAQDYARRNDLKLRGGRAFPHVFRCVPGALPQSLPEEEYAVLARALEGAIGLESRLDEAKELFAREDGPNVPVLDDDGSGWHITGLAALPEWEEPAWPAPLPDADMVRRLKKLRRKGSWECDTVMFTMPDGESGALMPTAFLVACCAEEELILPTEGVPGPDGFSQQLMRNMAAAWEELGVLPLKCITADERTYTFLQVFCRALNIRLERLASAAELEELEALEYDMLDNLFSGGEGAEQADGQAPELADVLLSALEEIGPERMEELYLRRGDGSDLFGLIRDCLDGGVFSPEVEDALRALLEETDGE